MSETFEQRWSEAEPSVRRLLLQELRRYPEVDPDDALQETRIYVYRRFDLYDPVYPFDVFARGLARNVAKRFRPRGRTRELEITHAEEVGYDNLQVAPTPTVDSSFIELLEVFFRWGGYPHQQVAFGFGLLLWGRPKTPQRGARRSKVSVTSDPSRVVSECGRELLSGSFASLLEELDTDGRLDSQLLRRLAEPAVERLQMRGSELFRSDATYRQLFVDQDPWIGETEMRRYFGKDPQKSVSDWIRAVRKRMEHAFFGQGEGCLSRSGGGEELSS